MSDKKASSAPALEVSQEQNQQYLTFILENEEYGVDILGVQEIRGWEETTHIPNAPAFIKGVINLRGEIVPILDLRLRFGMPSIPYSSTTVVIVLRLMIEEKQRVVGMVVDAVSDVFMLQKNVIQEAPDLGKSINTKYIRGIVNVQDKIVILLKVEELVDMRHLDGIANADDLSANQDTD